MVKIKISVPERYPSADLSQFLDQTALATHSFHFNEQIPKADAWFVIEGTLPEDSQCFVPPNRVFFLGAETARPLGFFYQNSEWLPFLTQFFQIYTPQELYSDNAHLEVPFLPWMINANHGPHFFDSSTRDLEFFRSHQVPVKTRELSVFCSAKEITPEHGSRLRFVSELKNHFGPRLDWFGNGVNAVDEKWEGLAPYKYSIVLENQAASHVLTEKIQDAFLALSKPIYWGAPQARDIFPPDSFTEIDIRDLRGSITHIEELLKGDSYQKSLPALLKAKAIVTDELNFMVRIQNILVDPKLGSPGPKQNVVIQPVSHFRRLAPPAQRNPAQRLFDNLVRRYRAQD